MRDIQHEAYVIIEHCQRILAEYLEPKGGEAKEAISKLLAILDGPRVQRFKKAALNPDHPPAQHASRLAADQERFRRQQNARTKALGVTINWIVRWDRASGSRQWQWEDRYNTNTPVYASWSADVQDNGDIVVTRTEYGYLSAHSENGDPKESPSE